MARKGSRNYLKTFSNSEIGEERTIVELKLFEDCKILAFILTLKLSFHKLTKSLPLTFFVKKVLEISLIFL
jgi:hypothetical protein